MKYKFLQVACVVIILIGTCSCFDIIEQIHFNKSKGGSASFTVTAEQSKDQIKLLMQLHPQNLGTVKIPSEAEFKKNLQDFQAKINAVPGISGAISSFDTDKFIFNLKFNFVDVAALNNVLNTFYGDMKSSNTQKNQTYSCDNKKFTRSSMTQIPDSFKDMLALQNGAIPNYKTSYTFDTHKIKSVSNTQSQISTDHKQVSLSVPIPALINGSASLANTITF